MNPPAGTKPAHAVLAPGLAALFPPGAVAALCRGTADPALLPWQEAADRPAGDPRRAGFAAGRLCARLVLAQFSIADFPLRTNPDRTPRWPDGIVGSIAHRAGFAAAVAARRADAAGIGIDMEGVADVKPDAWPLVCTPAEWRRLRALPRPARQRRAALLFCAKEAFYKCQYPGTGAWLEFTDLAIDCPENDADAGCFTVSPAHPRGAPAPPVRGRFLFDGGRLMAGVALPAAATSPP
jgi:4'-phosphopantetheinyl transferase EntD